MPAATYSHANDAPLAVRLQLAQDPAAARRDGPGHQLPRHQAGGGPQPQHPADLLRLAGRYWADFLESPLLPLLLLEDPGLPHWLPLRALVRREEVPPLILQTLARHLGREVR